MRPVIFNANRRSEKGFALIEALIAALLLSIGVLGIVGLQISTVTDYLDTKRRQYATVMATDLVDRMRANRAGINSYQTGNLAAAAHNTCAADIASPCTPSLLALDDLHHWKAGLAVLGFDPAMTGITVDAVASPVTVSLTLGWATRNGASSITVKTSVL